MASQGVRVVAVSIDADVENAKRFMRQQGLALPAVHDGPKGLARELDLKSVPLTLVLDRQGRVAYTTSRSDEAAVAEVGRVAQQMLAGIAAPASAAGDAR
jgi:peroxiredoxin